MYSASALGKKPSVAHTLGEDDVLDELPPSREMLRHYKEKMERTRKDFEELFNRFQNLNTQNQEKIVLESELSTAELKIRKLTDTLSKTQALLIAERKQSQQMALHIDMLQQQHELDREKLDQLLSLDGRATSGLHSTRSEAMLQHQVQRLEKLIREQGSSLLEERLVMKSEWDRERQMHERVVRQLREKAHKLQEELFRVNRHAALIGRRSLEDYIHGKTDDADIYYELLDNNNINIPVALKDKAGHCDLQEIKKFKKLAADLHSEVEGYKKKSVSQAATIRQLTEQLQRTEDKFLVQAKAVKEQITKLKQQNTDLNKRRLNEGAGFRAEIQLLKEKLQRTERQLCYLTVRKLEE